MKFVEEWEADFVFGRAEGFDLFIGAGFLGTEVVAREADDAEALVFELFVQSLQLFVLLGQTAAGGDVDDEKNFALIGFQAGVFAVDVLERNIEDGFVSR
jgi:hypothetical protein